MGVSFASWVLAPAINVGRLFHGFAGRAAVFAVSYRAAAHRVRAFLSFWRHSDLLQASISRRSSDIFTLPPALRAYLPGGNCRYASYSFNLPNGAALQRFPLSPDGFRRLVNLGRDRAQRGTDGASDGNKRVVVAAAGMPVRFRVHSILRLVVCNVW
jgi:hypothetical protein